MWNVIASLLPAVIAGGSAIFGSNQDTSTTSTELSPEMEAIVKELMEKAGSIYTQEYPTYEGDRVAGPTGARDSIDAMMPQFQSTMSSAMSNPYAGVIDQVINRSPVRVSLPTMVQGGPTASLTGGGFGSSSWATNPGTGGAQQRGGGRSSWGD